MLNYKSLLLFISLLPINNAFGQENVNTYKTKKGTSISIGDELTLGKGYFINVKMLHSNPLEYAQNNPTFYNQHNPQQNFLNYNLNF